jgi:hypothetical protein
VCGAPNHGRRSWPTTAASRVHSLVGGGTDGKRYLSGRAGWDVPFFVYFAPGATHAPHQVPKEWADRCKGRFDGGWDVLREEILARLLYLHGGRPKFCYNLLGLERFKVEGDMPVPSGAHQVRMEFAYDGGGLGKGGTVTLYVDGAAVGEGRVEATVPMIYSADETCDVGCDTASPVSDDYAGKESVFSGKIVWVQIDIAEAAEDVDHLIAPEDRLRIAMTRQ